MGRALIWRLVRLLLLILFLSASVAAQPSVSKVWVADNRDGTYRNPILHADYSDPDVIRVGDDFYLVASSFNAAPGLPVLHSRDLVNWTIISHALARQPPFDVFSKPQHGNGVWAPAIRYHNETFYIFYADPDYGIYIWLRVRVEENAVCSFSYSLTGRNYIPVGQQFNARQGKWIGAKVGIFAAAKGAALEMGYADYDWFRIE